MKNNPIITEITVQGTKVNIMRVLSTDYISLTDLAKRANSSDPSFTVKNWLRRVSTIDFLGLWEQLSNPDFNLVEFDQIKKAYGKNSFAMSPTQWIRRTNAIGIVSKGGKYSLGTFAHPDIAFEFASWLSPEFKLYLIKEFERLKINEAYQYKLEWQANRILAKANYVIHTDAIKENIIPLLTEKQKQFAYASEADALNVALFGMTAKEWRDKNPELAKKGDNIRDHSDLLHLIILSNIENINAELINKGLPQPERLDELNKIARNQVEILRKNNSIKELSNLQNNINQTRKLKQQTRNLSEKPTASNEDDKIKEKKVD